MPPMRFSLRIGGRSGRDRVVFGFTTTYAISCRSPITLWVRIPLMALVYSIQHYVIKFVSDLRQIGGFLRFPPPIKLTVTI